MKTPIFPTHTLQVEIEQPSAARRFTFSLVEMAILTGIVVRVYRMVVVTHGSIAWWYIGSTFLIGFVLLLGMATLHLANYPLHQYWWRSLAFAGVEVATEMVTSLGLIWLGREPNGTVRAHFDDWPTMAVRALLLRGIAILLWGLMLAMIVQVARRTIVHEDEDEGGEREASAPRA